MMVTLSIDSTVTIYCDQKEKEFLMGSLIILQSLMQAGHIKDVIPGDHAQIEQWIKTLHRPKALPPPPAQTQATPKPVLSIWKTSW